MAKHAKKSSHLQIVELPKTAIVSGRPKTYWTATVVCPAAPSLRGV